MNTRVVHAPNFENLEEARKFVEDMYLGLYRAASLLRESRSVYLRSLADLAKAVHFMIVDAQAEARLPYSHLRIGALVKSGYAPHGFTVYGLFLEAIPAEEVSDKEDVKLRKFFGDVLGIEDFGWGDLTNARLHSLFTLLQRALEHFPGDWVAKIVLFLRSVNLVCRCKQNGWEPVLFVQIPEYMNKALQPYGLPMAVAPVPVV